jgi:signal peptidase I
MIMTRKQEIYLFEATGFSMWPILKSGNRLIVENTAASSLSAGDVILYRLNEQIVCHRLIKKISSSGSCVLYCRGDVSIFTSDRVDGQMLLGRVMGVVDGDKVINFHSLPYRILNKIMLAAGPLLALAVMASGKLLKK